MRSRAQKPFAPLSPESLYRCARAPENPLLFLSTENLYRCARGRKPFSLSEPMS